MAATPAPVFPGDKLSILFHLNRNYRCVYRRTRVRITPTSSSFVVKFHYRSKQARSRSCDLAAGLEYRARTSDKRIKEDFSPPTLLSSLRNFIPFQRVPELSSRIEQLQFHSPPYFTLADRLASTILMRICSQLIFFVDTPGTTCFRCNLVRAYTWKMAVSCQISTTVSIPITLRE